MMLLMVSLDIGFHYLEEPLWETEKKIYSVVTDLTESNVIGFA